MPLPPPITVQYKNWRGETSLRTICPHDIWYGESPYHVGKQWFIKANDLDEQGNNLGVKDFALKDCNFTIYD